MSILWDTAYELFKGFRGLSTGASMYHGTTESYDKEHSADSEPKANNISTVYTCARILSSTLSMMPISTTKEGKINKEHNLYYPLRHRMNDTQNNQVMVSTLEYMRNIYGNAFVDIRKGKYEIIPIEVIDDWDYKSKNGTLRYQLNWPLEYEVSEKRGKNRQKEWVEAKDILHFKGMSADGVMGLPPVSAAYHNMNIMNKATQTIESFYSNRAMSPMSVESTLPDSASAGKLMVEQIDIFKGKYTGTGNAGKTIFLPPNTKLTPLQIHFQDAQLIDTLKFTRDEICNMYGIPSFMHNSTESVQLDIENMSKVFKQFTVIGITSIYDEELKYKLLKKDEIVEGWGVAFDTDKLVASDITSQANAYAKFIQTGVMSPGEASRKLGFEESESEMVNYHYVQAQLLPLELYSQVNPMMNKQNDPSKNKKEDKIEPNKE